MGYYVSLAFSEFDTEWSIEVRLQRRKQKSIILIARSRVTLCIRPVLLF